MLIAEFSHKGEEIEIDDALWQHDYGQKIQIKGLDLPEVFEVHFAWKDIEKAKVVTGSTVDGVSIVDIPNIALEQRRAITAYIYLSNAVEGETVNTILMTVNKRKAPENFEIPEKIDLFHHTVEATAEYQRRAKESEKNASTQAADAEAWAHGREDHPGRMQDNAKYYAEQAAKSTAEVAGKTEQAKKDIEAARNQAVSAVTSQQETSVQAVATEGKKHTDATKKYAETVASSRQAVEETAQAVATQAQEVSQNTQTVANNMNNAAKSAESAQTSANNAAKSAEGVQGAVDQITKNTQDVASLKGDLADLTSSKISKFYASNQGENHLADSDSGKIADMMVYGKSEQKQYSGKNLFDKESKHSNIDIGNYWDNTKRTIVGQNVLNWLDKENTNKRKFYVYPIKANSNYTLSFHGNITNNMYVGLANTSGIGTKNIEIFGNVSNKNIKIITGENETYLVLNTDGTADVMLELGTEAHTYEPYTGGIPSPSPNYPQEIKSVVNPTVRVFGGTLGNKLNNKQINWLIENMNIWHDNIHFVLYDEFGINGSIRLVVCVYENDINNYPCTFIDTDGNITTGRYQIDSINNDVKNKFIHCNMLPIADTRNVSTVVDSDSNKTVGLPNNYQTVTLPYTLNAIPVSSGGNVTIDGQQYIADYVDIERGKLIRNIDSVIFNGAENESWMLWNREDDTRWSFMYLFGVKAFSLAFYYYARSNAFTHDSNEKTDNRFWLCNPSNNPSIQIRYRTVGKDVSAFKTWLSKNPVVLQYALATPTETDLTPEEIQVFKALATYYPVTNISVNSEQLDGYTVFNYPISMANGWNYVKQQLNDNRDYIYDMDAKTQDIDTQSAEAYVNSEYAVALTELEV